jgi:hypothetical protein
MEEPTITITVKEYDELCEAYDKLLALENAGVDNWDGYDLAMESMEEMEGSEED